jgi:division/cell wall cluster transcriptional repressor MraZ
MNKCLNLYSAVSWKEFTDKIEALPKIKMEALRQMIYPNSDEVDLDSQGRIILNQRLCADVGLVNAKEVIITGAHTHAQIWNVSEREQYNEKMNTEENKAALLKELLEIGF